MRFLFSIAISIILLAIVFGTTAFLYFSNTDLRVEYREPAAR